MAQIIRIKRSQTPNSVPSALALGELAANVADDPIRMWIGTGIAVKELFVGAAVEDAEDDAVYGRWNGDWVQMPAVADAAPSDPAPNMLWWDSSTGKLFIWYIGPNSSHWVEVT